MKNYDRKDGREKGGSGRGDIDGSLIEDGGNLFLADDGTGDDWVVQDILGDYVPFNDTHGNSRGDDGDGNDGGSTGGGGTPRGG